MPNEPALRASLVLKWALEGVVVADQVAYMTVDVFNLPFLDASRVFMPSFATPFALQLLVLSSWSLRQA